MKNKKILFAGMILGGALLVLLFFMPEHEGPVEEAGNQQPSVSFQPSTGSAEVVLPVQVAVARRGDLIQWVRTSGTIRARGQSYGRRLPVMLRIVTSLPACRSLRAKCS